MTNGLFSLFSSLIANTPPYRKELPSRKFLSLFLILFLAVGNVWGQEVKGDFKNGDIFLLTKANVDAASWITKGSALTSTGSQTPQYQPAEGVEASDVAGSKADYYKMKKLADNREITLRVSGVSKIKFYAHAGSSGRKVMVKINDGTEQEIISITKSGTTYTGEIELNANISSKIVVYGTNELYVTAIKVTTPSTPAGGADPVDPTFTYTPTTYTIGDPALDLSTKLTSNSGGAISFAVSTADAGTTGASIANGKDFTATTAGTATITVTQAETTGYNAKTQDIAVSVVEPDPCTTYYHFVATDDATANSKTNWSGFTNAPTGSNGQDNSVTIDGTTYTLKKRTGSTGKGVAILGFTIPANKAGTLYGYMKSSGSAGRTLSLKKGDEVVATNTEIVDGNWTLITINAIPQGTYTLIPNENVQIQMFALKVCDAVFHTVTFNSNGGSSVVEQSVLDGTTAIQPTDPTWEHHRFDGWYNGETLYDWSDNVTGDLTLTAHWTQLYTITYAAGDGTATGDAPTQVDKAEGETFTVAANTFEVAGKDFDIWNDGSADYAPGATYTVGTANVVLTAQWKAPVVKHTISFNSDGGTAVEPIEVEDGQVATVPTAPKKVGYEFDKWYNDEAVYDWSAAVTGDLTLTAHWNKVYVPQGANYVFENTATLGTAPNAITVTKDNKTNAIAANSRIDNMWLSAMSVKLEDGTYSGSGDDFKGWKINTSAATIRFFVENDSRVTVTVGNLSSGMNIAYTGTDDAARDEGLSAKNANAYNVKGGTLVTLTTQGGNTVTLKGIAVSEIPDISNDATLKDLKVNGTTIAGFNSATDSYYIEMPYGTQKADLPLVTATANHDEAEVTVQDARDRDDTRATIKVTAKDGTEKYYYVYFTIALKQGVNLVKATIGDKSIALVANESYIKSAIVENSGVNGRDGGVSAGSKFQKGSYIKIEMPTGQQFEDNDIVDLEVTGIGGTYKLLVYSENSTAKDKLVVDEATAPTLVVGHNKVQLNKDAQALYLVRDDSNGWNPHVKSIIIQRYMAPFIETFEVAGAQGVVDGENKTITVEVPASTDVTALTPTIVAWANGGAKVTPTGAQDFTNPVTYSVASEYAEDGTTEYTVTVTKAAGIKEVNITGGTDIKEDETITLSATVIDTNDAEASNQNVTWTSNDETTAIVDANGVVTGVKAGTVTITATSVEDNTKSTSVTITVAVNPCRTWNAPAESFSGDVTKGKLSIKNSGCSIDDINPFSGASKVYAYKIDGSSDYVELSFIDKSQFETLTLGVSSGSNGSTPTFAVVASKSAVFDEKTIVEIFTYNANAKDAEQSLVDVSIPEGTRNVRIYRKYNDIGSGSSVSVYYVNACKKDFVPLTSISLADANLAVGRTLAQKVVVNPTNADIQTTTWSIESATATGVTIDAATGVLTAAADATEGTVSVKVQVTDILGNTQEATATITIITEYTQANVTESIIWDWTVAAMGMIKTENNSTEYLMANVNSNVVNNDDFRSDMLLITAEYANRELSNQFLQGTKIRFKTTVDGLVRVYFRSTGEGKNVEITINGISAGSGDAFQWSNYIEVPAGEVTIVGTGIGANATGLTRIQKIEFLALGHRREASWIVPNELGTVCLKDECIIKGAELYELQGPDENRKLVFDDIPSGELEAGKPYLFNATATGRISFYNKVKAKHTETAGSLNGMYGTFEDLKFSPATDQNIYYFSGHNIWAVKKNTANVELPAYLCYVKMDEFLASPVPDANPAPGRRRVTLGVNGQQVATGVDKVQGDEVPTKMIINGQLFILRGEKMYDAQGKLVK